MWTGLTSDGRLWSRDVFSLPGVVSPPPGNLPRRPCGWRGFFGVSVMKKKLSWFDRLLVRVALATAAARGHAVTPGYTQCLVEAMLRVRGEG